MNEREFNLLVAVAILGLLAFVELVVLLVVIWRKRPMKVVGVVRVPVFIPVLPDVPTAEITPPNPPAPETEWDPINDPDGWKDR